MMGLRLAEPSQIEGGEHHHRASRRDLTALCRPCHIGVTAMLRERRYAGLTLPAPGQVSPPLAGGAKRRSGEPGDA